MLKGIYSTRQGAALVAVRKPGRGKDIPQGRVRPLWPSASQDGAKIFHKAGRGPLWPSASQDGFMAATLALFTRRIYIPRLYVEGYKVMYGFPSMEAAFEAYKGQYTDGWKVGTVTEVSREDFKKWVESSHRKTKPFADYKSMKTAAKQQLTERDGDHDRNVAHEVNNALLNKNKKRALETASPSLNGTDHQTVVSSTLGAKVLKDLDNLVNEYEFNKGNKPNTFIGDLSRALEAQKHGSNSEYANFEIRQGTISLPY